MAKKTKPKAVKPAPQAATQPTKTSEIPVANYFKTILDLLKGGMFPGACAGAVTQSIGFLEANIKAMEAQPLSVVKDEEA